MTIQTNGDDCRESGAGETSMTSREKFDLWFQMTFPNHLYPEGDSRDELQTYTWLAWRDSRRTISGANHEQRNPPTT